MTLIAPAVATECSVRVESSPLEVAVIAHGVDGKRALHAPRSQRTAYFFEQPVTETTLKIAADGGVFVGVTASGAAKSGGFLRTRDRGASWQHLVPSLADNSLVLNAAMGSIAIDPSTQRIFASSLGDPSCEVSGAWAQKIVRLARRNVSWSDTLAFSDDAGANWQVVRGCFRDAGDWGKTFVGPAATPRTAAALAAKGYPNVVYHCAGATFSTTSYCFRSLDGGATFRRTRTPVFSDYAGRTRLPYGEAPTVPAGHPRGDRHTLSGPGVVASDGTIYIPANINGLARLYVSRDEGDSWEYVAIPVAHVRAKKSYGSITGFQDPPNGGRPWKPQQPFHAVFGSTAMSALWSQQLAIDPEGTLYLCWVDALDDLPYLAVSRDRGRRWSQPCRISPSDVNLASISAIAVRGVGEVAIAYYASHDGGERFDGMLSVSYDALAAEPHFESAQTCAAAPIQPNRVSKPIEMVGVAFAPDAAAWASFARDTGTLDERSPEPQCDGNFNHNGTRFQGVVLTLRPSA